MAKLLEINGYTPGRAVPVSDPLVIGRDPGDGGLVIANREASRRHAQILKRNASWWVEDLNSANGTFIDNIRQSAARLAEGSIITIGRTTFRFSLEAFSDVPTERSRLGFVEGAGSATDRSSGSSTPSSPPPSSSPKTPASESRPASRPRSSSAPVWNLTIDARSSGLNIIPEPDPEHLRRERDLLSHLFEISRSLGTILHLPELAQQILLKLFELFPAAENASIHLSEQGNLDALAARSRESGPIDAPSISSTIATMALSDRQSILSTDAAEDSRFVGKESIILQRVRSFMCSPLLFRDEALGVLYVDTTDARPRFTVDDLHLFAAVSAQMAIAVKNSRLLADNVREAGVRMHLARYLSPDLVDQVLHHQIDLQPGGSLYEGTVLFSDVVGFTPMAERMGAELLVQTLNRYFKYMVAEIFRYGGSVNQFGGDSIMALWGVPVKRGNHAHQAICSAIAMQAAIHAFNLTWRDGESHPLRVGIGVNTGVFIMGNVGSEQHMAYTALGNEVNLAQRIESQAAGSQVFLSERSYLAVADLAGVFRLPPKALKGVGAPMPIYSVRSVRFQDDILCAIPIVLMIRGRADLNAVLVRGYSDGMIEVWLGEELPPRTAAIMSLNPPEAPGFGRSLGVIDSCYRLPDFDADGSRPAWKALLRLERLPAMLDPPFLTAPQPGREYIQRS